MKTCFKILAFAMSITLLACSSAEDTEQSSSSVMEQSSSSFDVTLSSSSSILNLSSSSFLQSSSSFEVTEMPVMSSKVVAYEKGVNYQVCATASPEKEVLKAAFPHIFDNEKEECNYFPACFPTASTANYYWILSEDMVVYKIFPGKGKCGGTDDGFFSAMLVCDDTAEGNLQDIVNSQDFNYAPTYIDPDWNCREGDDESRGVFF